MLLVLIFSLSGSIECRHLYSMVTQTMLVFHAFNIRVRTLLCDGASCNLSFLKLQCGSNEKDDDELASIVPTKPWFVSPRDEEEVYLIICPSHQVIYLLTIHIITHSILVWLKNMIAALYSSKTMVLRTCARVVCHLDGRQLRMFFRLV